MYFTSDNDKIKEIVGHFFYKHLNLEFLFLIITLKFYSELFH